MNKLDFYTCINSYRCISYDDNKRYDKNISRCRRFFSCDRKNNIYDSGCTKFAGLTIINTFLEAYDFSGKTIILFATSGGSGMGNSAKELRPSVSDSAVIKDGKRFSANASVNELKEWIKSLGI
jgi:hypothetical protein